MRFAPLKGHFISHPLITALTIFIKDIHFKQPPFCFTEMSRLKLINLTHKPAPGIFCIYLFNKWTLSLTITPTLTFCVILFTLLLLQSGSCSPDFQTAIINSVLDCLLKCTFTCRCCELVLGFDCIWDMFQASENVEKRNLFSRCDRNKL